MIYKLRYLRILKLHYMLTMNPGQNARGQNARGQNARGQNARGQNARGQNARK